MSAGLKRKAEQVGFLPRQQCRRLGLVKDDGRTERFPASRSENGQMMPPCNDAGERIAADKK